MDVFHWGTRHWVVLVFVAAALHAHLRGRVRFGLLRALTDYTVLIVTHNMQQAARCSDFTAYMYLGELIEYGPTSEIFMKPKKKDTEDYITGRFG